jgi:hypothetical protein
MNKYAVCHSAVPVFNTADIGAVFGGKDGNTLKMDDQGLCRELEYIALPGSVFEILGSTEMNNYSIFNVKTDRYPDISKLYIDSRFVEITDKNPDIPPVILPDKDYIYGFLDNALDSIYIWGGNYIKGVEKMLEYYPPKGEISRTLKLLWTFKGYDCSGLMYEATNGYTERNTSRLIYSGEAVDIEGLKAKEIKAKLEPLDMLVWRGHVIYVYNENTAIQSALSKGGVVKTDLLETLTSLLQKRLPVNDYDSSDKDRFVIRRWYK